MILLIGSLISISELFAQYQIKYSKITNDMYRLIFGLAIYMLVGLLLWTSYAYANVGHMNLVWSCMSIILAYVSGIMFFGEVITHYNMLSMFFAFVAIFLSCI